MLKFWRKNASKAILNQAVSTVFEKLEDRRLLSASWGDFGGGHRGHSGGFAGQFGGRTDTTIAFSLAPSAVQTGLDSLATADGLTDPTSTQLVSLNNVNGVETYSVTLSGTGTVSKLTVDQLGDAVTAPTQTTTTWATLSGTGTGSDAAAATEITAIATAENLTAPAGTDTVNVSTSSTGAVTYSIRLTSGSTSSTSWGGNFGQTIAVDSSGNPVGNQQLPFSVIPSAIQTALNSHAPTGATALATTSTQTVDVQTTDGVVTYSTTFTASGVQTTITVDIAGALTSLPSTTTTTFSALSSGVQTELQTLATADGVTTTIAANQSINVLTETNGTVIYGAELSATGTGHNGNTYTFDVTIAVDSNGNPTTLPQGGNGFFGFGGPGFGPGGFQDAPGANNGNNTNSSGGTTNSSSGTTNASSGTTVSLPSSGTSTSSSLTGGSYTLSAKVLSAATNGLGVLGAYFVELSPATVDSAVQADLKQIQTDQAQLASDTKALTKTQRTTLATDTKAINTAIKAISSTLAPLEATLKADAKTWKTTLAKDETTIRKDKKNATALATAKAQLATDEASAFAAIAGDEGAIQTATESASGVVTADAKLATDLPTIAADESAIQTEQAQLVTDIEAQS